MKESKTVLPNVNGHVDQQKLGHHSKSKPSEMKSEMGSVVSSVPSTAAAAAVAAPPSTIPTSTAQTEELVGGCCVCSDDQGFANNALVYCDGKGCTVACHTACYGIVSIPDGDWYCGRCEAKNIRAPCQLCPTIEGAMKRTSEGGWAHVVCALYIPEVSFGDDSTMEPIILSKIPSSRYGQECSICVQNGRSKVLSTSGACCNCTYKNCSQVFHVTCAQANGLLCEDVRKNNCQYPIFCEQHRPKLSKFIRQIPAFSYSPNGFASPEELTKQHLHSKDKEKESPSQLSDFITPDSTVNETNLNSRTSSSSSNPNVQNDNDTRSGKSSPNAPLPPSTNNNTSSSSATQQKTHSRSSSNSSSSNSSIQKKVKLTDENNLSDLSQFVQLNKDERSFSPTATAAAPSSAVVPSTTEKNDSNKEEHKTSNSHLQTSIEEKSSDAHGKSSHASAPVSKKNSTSSQKDDDPDEDFQIGKKRKLSSKSNKDGQPRKQRQHSSEGGPRPVGRPPSKKTLLAQTMTNGLKRPGPKPTMNNSNNNNNMKRSKYNDTSITMQSHSSEKDIESETKANIRSNTFYPCDHFGNQLHSDAYQQQVQGHGSISTNDRSRSPSRNRIDFYPRRPLQDTASNSSSIDPQSQRPFPPQTLEEFLEQEWELSSDFLLQQTMPHDVSSLLSCLYQFKAENAALQKKFDELRHRRDSLRVTNANLRRRLAEVLPLNDPISGTSTATTVTTAPAPTPTTSTATVPAPSVSSVPQVSPPVLPAAPAPVPVPPSPRKEQQIMKQQKLNAEIELQQHLQQQKSLSPTRRRLSTNNPNSSHQDPNQSPTIKKSKSPRQPTAALSHQSILESQLRQSAMTMNVMKKPLPTTPIPKKVSSIPTDMDMINHPPPPIPLSSSTPSTSRVTSSPYEQIDVAATAAAALALAKNGRAAGNTGLNLELLSQIFAATGNAIGPQLFAPTWNISNFGYANFPGANPMSVSDESILRSYAPPTHPPLDQQQQQTQSQPAPAAAAAPPPPPPPTATKSQP